MDNRLGLFYGKRVSKILRDNLPEVSRALVMTFHGQAVARNVRWNNMNLIHLHGNTVNTAIMGEDWEKIAPYIANGHFSIPAMTPFGSNTIRDDSPIDVRYTLTYNRVYETLSALFSEEAPKPKL